VSKLLIVAAAAGGYVLGAKAGRDRYEQIRHHAMNLWNSGPVQQGVHEAEGAAKHAAQAAGSKVADAASSAGSRVAARVRHDDAPQPGGTEPSEPTPGTSFN
jgi:hypothetical protein